MKSLFLIIYAFILISNSEASALWYEKRINNDIFFSDGVKGGKSEEQGYFGPSDIFPGCKRLNAKFKGLRQGLKVFYKPDGNIDSVQNGIFDCKYNGEQVSFFLVEGFSERPGVIQVVFMEDNFNTHYYTKYENKWNYATRAINYGLQNSPAANLKIREATLKEIDHAEKLYKFYKEIDLSSANVKKYAVINTSIRLNEIKKTEEQVPIKKQSSANVAGELEKLDKLLKSGAITKDEYQKAKNKILN
jgi:hypothetical protein